MLKFETSQLELESNLQMYESVWDKIINGRQIDLINLDSFDEGVTAVAASPDGDIVGLENFKSHYSNYITGFLMQNLQLLMLSVKGIKL